MSLTFILIDMLIQSSLVGSIKFCSFLNAVGSIWRFFIGRTAQGGAKGARASPGRPIRFYIILYSEIFSYTYYLLLLMYRIFKHFYIFNLINAIIFLKFTL